MPFVRQFLATILAILFAVAAPALAQDEPVAARKPLGFWIKRLESKDPKVRQSAADNMDVEWYAFGPDDDFGFFGEDAGKKRSSLRHEAKPFIPRLLYLLKNGDENVAGVAAGVLMMLGTDAKAVAPELERFVLDKKSPGLGRMIAFNLLPFVAPVDKPVGPILFEMIESLPKEALGEIGLLVNENASGDNDGKRQTTAENPLTTPEAILTLSYMATIMHSARCKAEVPYILKIATGESPTTIRAHAIIILGALQFEAQAAIPALWKLLRDKDRVVATWAAYSLIQIELDPKLVPEISKALDLKGKERKEFEQHLNGVFEGVRDSREYLRNIARDEHSDKSIQFYVRMLKYGNKRYRREGIRCLGIIGPAAKFAVPELREALRDPDADTRRMAAEALRQIDPQSARRDRN